MDLLALEGIGKSFGGVTALSGVDFSLRPGEIHGLVGENGAGKSTLMKIIAGVHTSFEGQMRLEGRPVRFDGPRAARDHGIGMVHQELATVPTLSCAENVFMGAPPRNRFGLVDWPAMRRGARTQLQSLGIDIDPATAMGALPLGMQQLVELSRVLFSGARIIILDEPTSALSPPEVERLFAALRRLREAGRSLIFISHFLDDVLAICDRVTVFRNGRAVATEACASVDKGWIIAHMIGTGHEHLEESYLRDIALPPRSDTPVVLRVDRLSCPGAFRDVSLQVHAGEGLGVYGVLGAGQIELERSLFGAGGAHGRVEVDGRAVRLRSSARARRAGIAYVPESRRMMLFAAAPVFKNVTISVLDRIGRAAARAGRCGRPAARRAVRRQPAEGGAGQVADPPAARAPAQRADARHGCRRQGGRTRDRAQPAGAADRRHRRVGRAGDRAVAGRPGDGDEAGADRARVRRRTGQQGPAARHRMMLRWIRLRLRNIAPFVTLLLLLAFFSAASDSFATLGNLQNILTQISVTGIIAVGLTFVILCGEIDLSVASVANATGIAVAFFTAQDASVGIANLPLSGGLAIVLALAACALLGTINAIGVTRVHIPSFIMTLAMLQIAAGVSAMLVRGQIAYAVPPLIETLGSRALGPVPWIVIVAATFLLVSHVLLAHTRFGRYVYMVGGNRQAAEYSGIDVRAVLFAAMLISALCSGTAGMLGVAYFGSAQQNEFDTYLLDSISAVVVGGTSLFGGQGGIGNTIIGLFVLGVLNNGLDHVNVDSFLKILIRGLILLVALIVNVYAQRLRTGSAPSSA